MCGIAGFFDQTQGYEPFAELRAMGHAIRRRGPDGQGVWFDASVGLGFVHQRLAVVDLSDAGAQPMVSRTGRYTVVFNGEIYNHASIRQSLDRDFGAQSWRGHSDTETLLAAIELRGFEAAIDEWVGMFALALFDRERQSLYLVRDRFGEKPLYFGRNGGRFFFASELRAMCAHHGFEARINRDALAAYFRHHYVPAPLSVYEGIEKLCPGEWVEVDADGQVIHRRRYWSAVAQANSGFTKQFAGSFTEACDEVERRLVQAVQLQSMADVPVGAFLSGGIDSSLVVSLMCAHTQSRVKTFTIGFAEDAFNEAGHAAKMASHLGTDHTELYLSGDDALKLLPEMPAVYDEPFADVSQLPTYAVACLARKAVTVSLSGDGGDELFGGYTRYARAASVLALRDRLGAARRPIGRLLSGLPGLSAGIVGGFQSGGTQGTARRWLNRGGRSAELLGEPNSALTYRSLVSFWRRPSGPVLDAREPATEFSVTSNWLSAQSPQAAAQMLDVLTFLPDQILVKVDRSAMAHSLETRAPLLDHHLAEFVWSLPLAVRANAQDPKGLLKRLLGRYVPSPLFDRPKQGFGIPVDAWLRGPLLGFAEDLLDESLLRRQGWLDAAVVRDAWTAFKNRGPVQADHIWGLVAFQAWLGAR